MAQARALTLESQELGTIAVDCGSQCSPTCQILERGHIWKAGGTSGHSSVLAVSDLWVGAELGQRVRLAPSQRSCRLGGEAWGFRHEGA